MSRLWTPRLAADDPLALPYMREEGDCGEHGMNDTKVRRLIEKTCGCKTPDQTGTLNGFMCSWHRERYVAAVAQAVRAERNRHGGHQFADRLEGIHVHSSCAECAEALRREPKELSDG